ncbi:MAG: Mth938-like domain-containing protein [Rhodobacteraceae bacterium]|nr:Mth938-like domain-containing protein [Paracoccaceae bacterium]
MRLSEIAYTDARPVTGYGPGFFRIGAELHRGAVLILPSGPVAWAGYGDTAALLAAARTIDVLFVGTGAEIAPIPAAFREALEAAGVGVEIMASPTACRTFNVLLAEGRRIGAALIPV